ncbi:MAG: DNA-3-methyladenine glycosylase 2 family protein [Bacteroidetes bacterium]|nr:DNA-3-methyladenine glycosylase 2 family protein [Bacteroidota bacterium]
MIRRFDADNFYRLCDQLGKKDADLKRILTEHGHPKMWVRPNSFQTLILTILEQQVSLAAAYAAFNRLKIRIGTVTPEKISGLSDAELKDCYFTRQKIVYARELTEAIRSKRIRLRALHHQPDEIVREQLIELKGIGHWTIDVYLMHALRRTDLFPLGDVALVNSLKRNKRLPDSISKEKMLHIAEPWRPNRTIAAMILWHDYMNRRKVKVGD